MTRALLVGIAEARVGLGTKFAVALLLVPFIAVVLLADAVVHVVRAVRRALVYRRDVAYCPRGHVVELHAAWECRCGLTYEGSAWVPCPNCEEQTHAIRCPCGLPVENPLSPVRG